jgi:hypothetical protein
MIAGASSIAYFFEKLSPFVRFARKVQRMSTLREFKNLFDARHEIGLRLLKVQKLNLNLGLLSTPL